MVKKKQPDNDVKRGQNAEAEAKTLEAEAEVEARTTRSRSRPRVDRPISEQEHMVTMLATHN